MIKHIIQFSGGAGSWYAGKRVVERYGVDGVVLLTADTASEAEDWYEFVELAAEDIGAELVKLPPVEPGGIFDLADKHKALPSAMMGFCSRVLKREPMDKWIKENTDPKVVTRHFGFDFYEIHRLERLREKFPKQKIDAPLCWKPVMDKAQVLEKLMESGLPVPEAYKVGLPHNNCLRTGCVKGGQAYWNRFRELFPERFAESEAREAALQLALNKPQATILKHNRRGVTQPLSLKKLRLTAEVQGQLDLDDWGACNCFTEET